VTATSSARFQTSLRLHRPAEFKLIYAKGRRFNNPYFTAAVYANSLAHPRLGLSIAARTIGNAVARNRIKRAVRESFRQHQQSLPALDIIIGARPAAREDSARPLLRASLGELWTRIGVVCAS
jgi:ribonuclease P protein component